MRQDHFKADIENTITERHHAGARQDQTVDFTSVRAGAHLAAHGRAVLLRVLQHLVQSVARAADVAPPASTQPLPPQENKSYEAGGKWDLNDGNLSLSAAAFQITQTNARSQNSDGTYNATGTVRVNGARAGAAGRITDQWQVFGAYTYLDATIIDGVAPGTQGKTPANTPQELRQPLGGLQRSRRNGKSAAAPPTSDQRYANNTDLVSVPGYTRFDAMVAYHQPKYDVRLNLFNLTNKMY